MENLPVQHQDMQPENTAYDVVALAASAGGLKAITLVLSRLPVNFPAALLVVQHLDPNYKSQMAQILGRQTVLETSEAKTGDLIQPGRVYVAPPGVHLTLLSGGAISLVYSPKVKFVRPSADLLFSSVASAYPGRAIGVVLTGSGSDGSTGIMAIKHSGGVVIAQNQATSEYFSMPGAAIQTGLVDFVLPLEEIPLKLIELTMQGR